MSSKTLTTAAIAAAIATALGTAVVPPTLAAEAHTKASQETPAQKQTDQTLFKVSDDARMTMRNVDGARLAIFDGDPGQAQVYADAAVTRVKATLKEADKYELDVQKKKTGARAIANGEKFVPFDAGFTMAELLKPTKDDLKHISKANDFLHKGETGKALEDLKAGGIDVALTTDLVPVQSAEARIEDASKLIAKGKYYDANLELKAVEDSVITQMYDTNALPHQKAGAHS